MRSETKHVTTKNELNKKEGGNVRNEGQEAISHIENNEMAKVILYQ